MYVRDYQRDGVRFLFRQYAQKQGGILGDDMVIFYSFIRPLALLHPETSISIQKRHPYTGNLNSETSGDSKNAFLHCGDALNFRDRWGQP